MNEQPQPLDPSTELTALMQENQAVKNQYSYDNEWIKFLADLATNNSTQDIVEYISRLNWTDRQKNALIMYTRGCLTRGLSTTYLWNLNDFKSAVSDFDEVETTLTIGMTRFEVTPEFIQVVGFVRAHLKLELRRSRDAHFVEQIGKQTTKLEVDQVNRDASGFKRKVSGLFQE